jgi:hypothetical protein
LEIVVEATTNLDNPFWIPVGTNVLTNNLSYFIDSGTTNHPHASTTSVIDLGRDKAHDTFTTSKVRHSLTLG